LKAFFAKACTDFLTKRIQLKNCVSALNVALQPLIIIEISELQTDIDGAGNEKGTAKVC